MIKLDVLHVASFSGNIGDNANHTGFRSRLSDALNIDLEYTEFEIREVFWKKKSFDDDFVELANNHDLLVIGGGNYFELWVEDSATGTSIDISLDRLKSISVPIIFNALGVDPAQGASDLSVGKFRKFLDYATASPSIVLSCRNDGSMQALKEIVGEKYAESFHHIPDAGMFTKVVDTYHPELAEGNKNILIQLAGDMIETRFPASQDNGVSFDDFLGFLASYITEISEKHSAQFIIVPHIFRDVSVAAQLLEKLPDNVRRSNVSVAPYLVGQKAQDYIFDLYAKSNLILGMRFHANICGIGLGVPCIGLVNYRQIEKLYEELDLIDFRVYVNKTGFHNKIFEITEKVINDEVEYPFPTPQCSEKLNEFHLYLRRWLKSLGTI